MAWLADRLKAQRRVVLHGAYDAFFGEGINQINSPNWLETENTRRSVSSTSVRST